MVQKYRYYHMQRFTFLQLALYFWLGLSLVAKTQSRHNFSNKNVLASADCKLPFSSSDPFSYFCHRWIPLTPVIMWSFHSNHRVLQDVRAAATPALLLFFCLLGNTQAFDLRLKHSHRSEQLLIRSHLRSRELSHSTVSSHGWSLFSQKHQLLKVPRISFWTKAVHILRGYFR